MNKKLALKLWYKSFPNKVHFNDNNNNDGCEGYLGYGGDTLYIWFNPTDSKKDWISNFNFFKSVVPYNDTKKRIQVHNGFLKLYKQKEIRNYIHEFIKASKIQNVIIAGHSMGGAFAQLCAVDIQYNFPEKNIECYIIDGPKVGNYWFKKSYNKRVPKTYYLINGDSLVPQLPFWWLGFLQIFTLGFFFMFSFKVGEKIYIKKRKWWKPFSFKDHEVKSIDESLNNL